MANLAKPQVPTPKQTGFPATWQGIIQFLTHTDQWTRDHVLYLQQYFQKVQTSVNNESQYDVAGNRPNPQGTANFFYATDTADLYMDQVVGNNPTWVKVAPASQVGTQAKRPASAEIGDFWYSSDFQTLYEWNGTQWIPIASRFFFEAIVSPATTYQLPFAIGSMIQVAVKNFTGGSLTVNAQSGDMIDLVNTSTSINNSKAETYIDYAPQNWAIVSSF